MSYISSKFSTSFHSLLSNLLEKNLFIGFRGAVALSPKNILFLNSAKRCALSCL